MKIGSAIKELRTKRGMSQGELCALCNLSQTSMSQIESDIKIPRDKNLDIICNALKVSRIGLYLLATDETELPKSKREAFRILRPAIVELFT